jgi:hypothetical protein
MKSSLLKFKTIPLVLALFCIISVLISGCASSKDALTENGAITGMLKVVGNEPFTRLALQAADGKTYILECSKELRGLLLQHQGYQTTVEYDSVRQSFEGTTLHVIQAKIHQTIKD